MGGIISRGERVDRVELGRSFSRGERVDRVDVGDGVGLAVESVSCRKVGVGDCAPLKFIRSEINEQGNRATRYFHIVQGLG